MKLKTISRLSILAIIPILIWNWMFYGFLPSAYQEGGGWEVFPSFLVMAESVLRIITFGLLAFMVLEVESRFQYAGLLIYYGGVILYLIVWTFQMVHPDARWSQSLIGFSALAWSPLLWLIGIGMMSKVYLKKYSILLPIYYIVATLFILVHTLHALIVFFDQ